MKKTLHLFPLIVSFFILFVSFFVCLLLLFFYFFFFFFFEISLTYHSFTRGWYQQDNWFYCRSKGEFNVRCTSTRGYVYGCYAHCTTGIFLKTQMVNRKLLKVKSTCSIYWLLSVSGVGAIQIVCLQSAASYKGWASISADAYYPENTDRQLFIWAVVLLQ